MKSLTLVAFLLAVLIRPAQTSYAATAGTFEGDSCQFRTQLWSTTQRVAFMLDTFDADMRAAYGTKNPYAGSPAATHRRIPLSGRAVAASRTLLAALLKNPGGLLPGTWKLSWSYGIVRPFGQGNSRILRALRTTFETEFALQDTLTDETKIAGLGLKRYNVARASLAAAWPELKAVPCVPATVVQLHASVQNGWVTFAWQTSSRMAVRGFTIWAHGRPLFQVGPSRTTVYYLYATPYLSGPYSLVLDLMGRITRSYRFPTR